MVAARHRSRTAVVSFVAAALLMVLGGCGGHALHRCHRGDQTMACILRQQPRPVPNLLGRQAPAVAYGVDFAWSCPPHSAASFGASYLSYDTSKNWTRACVARFRSRVAVWETSANRSTAGYKVGFSDAREASRQLVALGAPAGQSFTMAIDFDASGPEVAPYFRGANAAEPGRVNAYGGFRPLLYLSQHGLVGHLNWQTYAWSGGAWLPASVAPLEQYLNASSVDYDRAFAANYGQWPAPTPAPKPKPKPAGKLKCWGPHAKPHHPTCERLRPLLARQSRARDATVRALGRNTCRFPYRRRVCRVLGQRHGWFVQTIHAELARY